MCYNKYKILDELDSKLSIINIQYKLINKNIIKSEILKQSILSLAFSGHLIPQDPDDEPAENLLECINAERAKSPSKKKPSNIKEKANSKQAVLS